MPREPLNAQHPARKILRFIESAAASPTALAPERQDARFNGLALELFAWQFEVNEPYRKVCVARHLTPAEVGDWTQIPTVPTAAFKDFEFS